MSFRALAAFPFAFAVVAASLVALAPADARAPLLHGLTELGKVLALLGLGAAALTFDRGDYLRRGFGLNACCYAFLLTRDVWLGLAPGSGSHLAELGRALLIVTANACGVTGTWTLARAWNVAGLELPGPRVGRWIAIGVAALASALFAGPSLAVDVRDAVLGVRNSWWAAASDLGDILALPLLAPVALTALAVRGGTLRWPWLLFSASLLGWLLYDAICTIPQIFPVEARPFLQVAEHFRLFATTSACAAGLAQRRAVLEDDE